MDIDGRRRTLWGLAALAVAGVVVGITVLAESSVQQPNSSDSGFNADRAVAHLEAFAREPRPMGGAGNDRARDYLAGELRSAGLAVEVQRAVGRSGSAGLATFGAVDNVIATLPGTDPTGTVLLVGHYDSAAVGPGTSDDGTAVAAILETARVLRAGTPPRNDVVLLLTDGEEEGLLGAEAFAREHPRGRRGGVVVNLEARGVTGPSLMFETSRDNAGLIGLFRDAVPHPRGDSSFVEVYRLLPNNSDFSALSKAGFAGYNFAYIEGASHYHTAGDSLANLDRGSLQHHGENVLSLSRALAAADLRGLDSGHDTTYFRVLGVSVGYPNWLVWPLAALPFALLVAAAVRRAVVARAVAAAASAVVPVAGAVVLGQALWWTLTLARPDYDAMGGLLHRPAPFQAAMVLLGLAAVAGWHTVLRGFLRGRRRVRGGGRGGAAGAGSRAAAEHGAALWIGALVWPAGLGVLCAAYAPGAAFLFTLPALAGAAAVLLGRPLWTVVAVAVAVAAAILPNFVRLVLLGAGLALGGAGSLLAAVFGLTVLPVVDWLSPRRPAAAGRPSLPGRLLPAALPVGLVAGCLVLAGAGLAADRIDARHPGRTHLAYVLNADTGRAFWVSAETEPTAWTRTFVRGRDTGDLPPGYQRRPLWTGPAGRIDAAGPRVTVRARAGDTVALHVASARAARSLTLRIDRPITAAAAVVPGHAPVGVEVSGERADTWPGEIRFRDLPAEGVELTFRTAPGAPVRVTAIDETFGLDTAPGFHPRPADLVAGTREDGDRVAVTTTVTVPA